MLQKLSFCSLTPLLLIASADQFCSRARESTITRFNPTEDNYELSGTHPDTFTNYTDHQLGIFRFAAKVDNLITFNLTPLTARVSMVSFSCGTDPHCVAALVAPNPWNPPDLLTRTLQLKDVQADVPRFTGFDNEWSTIRMTNSSDGRIDVLLCAGQAYLTLFPASDNYSSGGNVSLPPIDSDCTAYNQTVLAAWMIPCQTMHYMVTPLAEQIDAALDRRQYQHTIKLVAVYLVAVVVVVALFYAVVMKFVSRSCLSLRSEVGG